MTSTKKISTSLRKRLGTAHKDLKVETKGVTIVETEEIKMIAKQAPISISDPVLKIIQDMEADTPTPKDSKKSAAERSKELQDILDETPTPTPSPKR